MGRLLILSEKGINAIAITAIMVPIAMNGILLPNLVLVLSDQIPNAGRSIRAKTLSIAITTPLSTSPRLNEYLRIRGVMASYMVQNEVIAINAKPVSIVFLKFNFIP
jgi:hypothetical protein